MTQPVQEPTQGRTDQRQDFGVRQLFRRPAPAPGASDLRGAAKYGVWGPQWDQVHTYNLWDFTVTWDSAAPFTGYADLGNAQNNEVGFGCPLGPQDSLWAVSAWFYRDTDYGQLTLEMATTPTDELTETAGSYGSVNSITDPTWTPASWYKPYAPGGVDQILEGYSASPGWSFNFFSPFWVAGTNGQMLAANGTQSGTGPPDRRPVSSTSEMLGGGDNAVWWWLKLKVSTKNASSTGYKAKVAGLQVSRMTGTGFAVI